MKCKVSRVWCFLILNCLHNLMVAGNPLTKKVLFIGNSLTSTNDLPRRLIEVGSALNSAMRFETTQLTPGGRAFFQHADKQRNGYTGALDKIEEGGWDYVILQEQSGSWFQLIDSKYGISINGVVVTFPTILVETIKSVNATPVFLATWKEKYGPMNAENQEKVTDAYSYAARVNNAYCAPCGDALLTLHQAKGDSFIYIDDVHPTYTAQVLNAYVLYATLTGNSPVGQRPGLMFTIICNCKIMHGIHIEHSEMYTRMLVK